MTRPKRRELEAEIARHHADFERWEEMAANGHARAERAEAEVERLRAEVQHRTAIVWRYARHDSDCPSLPCDCGLTEVFVHLKAPSGRSRA